MLCRDLERADATVVFDLRGSSYVSGDLYLCVLQDLSYAAKKCKVKLTGWWGVGNQERWSQHCVCGHAAARPACWEHGLEHGLERVMIVHQMGVLTATGTGVQSGRLDESRNAVESDVRNERRPER